MTPLPEHLHNLVGQSVAAIDTPAAVLDLDAMERNIARMADFAREHGMRWRPHAKLHKSAAIALLLEKAGAIGHCVQKTAEAEALAKGVTMPPRSMPVCPCQFSGTAKSFQLGKSIWYIL